ARWRRDLAVSYNKIGDVLKAQGNLAEALKSFRESLGIRERLAKADPDSADGQRDLSVYHERVGDVLKAQGNLAEALKSFRESLVGRGGLGKGDAVHGGWQAERSL